MSLFRFGEIDGRIDDEMRRGINDVPVEPLPPDGILERIQGEYIEMPGLRLTLPQAQRLWGLDRTACDAVLGALVEAKFLTRNRDGTYARP